MGRDQFYLLLDESGLKLRRKRRKPRPTDSTHGLPTYPNPAWDFLPTAPNQLWAADITYIELTPSPGHTRLAYLALILDCYTEEIVGWGLGDTLKTTHPIEALRMALQRLPPGHQGLIHHRDRGVQYVSRNYVALLQAQGIAVSMTNSQNPEENASTRP